MESTNVDVQNMLQERNNITFSTNCKYQTAATDNKDDDDDDNDDDNNNNTFY
jgi:hypothetical protein